MENVAFFDIIRYNMAYYELGIDLVCMSAVTIVYNVHNCEKNFIPGFLKLTLVGLYGCVIKTLCEFLPWTC